MLRNAMAVAGLLAVLGGSPVGTGAQQHPSDTSPSGLVPINLTIRTGSSSLGSGGDVLDLFRRDLGLDRSALESRVLEMELSAPVGGRTDVFVGGAVRSSEQTVTEAWEDVGGPGAAEQTTRLSVTPGLYVGARWFVLDRGGDGARRAAWTANPYVTVGAGRGSYSLRQSGEFVDGGTQERFTATFVSRDGYYRAFLGIGADFAITDLVGVTMDARRDFGSPTPEGDFHRFDDLGLSGSTLTVGFRLLGGR